MIKWIVIGAAVSTGFAFGAGAYVGWKTTLKVVDSVKQRLEVQRG